MPQTIAYMVKLKELQDREYSTLHRWNEMQDLDTFMATNEDADNAAVWEYVGTRIKALERDLADVRRELKDLAIERQDES